MMQIIGKGGFGREVVAYCNKHNIDTFTFENECHNMQHNRDAVIAIGDEEVRDEIVNKFSDQSWGILNLGKAYGKLYVGAGTIICPGTILTDNVNIYCHCIININCTIGHDVRIGNFVTVNPGVNISGNVTIGDNCNIGSNAVIRNGINICDDVVIGAGSVVVKDITEPGVYVGSPAVRLDKRPAYVLEETFNKKIGEITSSVLKKEDVAYVKSAEKDYKSASILNAPQKQSKSKDS